MNPFTWTKITAAVGYIQLSGCNEDKIPQTFSPLYISMFSIKQVRAEAETYTVQPRLSCSNMPEPRSRQPEKGRPTGITTGLIANGCVMGNVQAVVIRS